MKNYMKLFYSGALIFMASSVFSDNASTDPVSEMMKQTSDMMEKGSKAMQEAADKAAKDAKAAVAKLPSFSINSMKDDDEESSEDFQWTMENIKLADQGDAKRGEELSKEAKCSKCHGDTGVSEEDDTPSIAGQVTAYSFKQLHDYKVGLRDSKSMRKKVKNMTPKDMADISAFYATQTPEKKLGSATPPVLAIKGDSKRYMLACDSCHNDDSAKRGYQTPIIDGQKIEYFIETMVAFKEEDRVNDHYSLMRAISAKLSEEEIEELAAYYSAKPLEED